jgi:hypothetical protein
MEHNQKVSYLYQNFKVHYSVYKNLAVLPSQQGLDCQSNPFRFSGQTFVLIHHSCVCYVPWYLSLLNRIFFKCAIDIFNDDYTVSW